MKRSEMVTWLAKYLESHIETDPDTLRAIADQVLEGQEALGMKPPEIFVDDGVWYRDTGNYGYFANEWEREDLGANKLIPNEDFDRLVSDLETENDQSS